MVTKRGDLVRGELGPLRSVSREVNSKRAFDGLEAKAFCRTPFGMGSGVGFMASIATEEATSSAGDREGEASFLSRFEEEATTLELASILFFVELPPQVFTMLMVWAKHKRNTNKERKMREKIKL